MDFARPLLSTASVASQSKIRYLDPFASASSTSASTAEALASAVLVEGETTPAVQTRNRELDRRVVLAANQAAQELFRGSSECDTLTPEEGTASNHKITLRKEDAWLVDASRYTERSTPIVHNGLIQAGDLVVIQESFDKLDFVYVKEKSIYQNRNGAFHHNDFINQQFGTKVRSRDLQGYGFIYVLKPTPELWTRSLNHRTQVVHELDQSQIVFQLHIQPNHVVVESGTGSGAMSHALLRTVAPNGHVHTYEFNRHRAHAARTEFAQHGLQHLVTVHHKDVCRGLVELLLPVGQPPVNDDEASATHQRRVEPPGFDLPGQSVDAVFLDLPEPWCAVPHAAFVLRPNARIATYSPCVEQTQKTVQALEQCGFHSIKTFEYRLMEHYVDEVVYESPPSSKRPRVAPHNVTQYCNPTVTKPSSSSDRRSGTDEGDLDDGDTCDETNVNGGPLSEQMSRTQGGMNLSNNNTEAANGKKHGPVNNPYIQKGLVARPFVTMRGHSAFLTFATAGLDVQPDPNISIASQGNDTSCP